MCANARTIQIVQAGATVFSIHGADFAPAIPDNSGSQKYEPTTPRDLEIDTVRDREHQ
jgi:hypothetical protein